MIEGFTNDARTQRVSGEGDKWFGSYSSLPRGEKWYERSDGTKHDTETRPCYLQTLRSSLLVTRPLKGHRACSAPTTCEIVLRSSHKAAVTPLREVTDGEWARSRHGQPEENNTSTGLAGPQGKTPHTRSCSSTPSPNQQRLGERD